MQFSLTVADALSEAEMVYHPVAKNASYKSQKDEAEPKIQEWLKGRFPRFMKTLEDTVKANESNGWVLTDKMTYADIMLFQFMRGYKTSQKAHWDENGDIPSIKAHFAKMMTVPAVKTFMESDRRTKMEEGNP